MCSFETNGQTNRCGTTHKVPGRDRKTKGMVIPVPNVHCAVKHHSNILDINVECVVFLNTPIRLLEIQFLFSSFVFRGNFFILPKRSMIMTSKNYPDLSLL